MAIENVAHILLDGPPVFSDSARHALQYQQLVSDMDILTQKEEMRQLRVNAQVLKAKVEDLDEELWQQKERTQHAEVNVGLVRGEMQSQLEETAEQVQTITTKSKSRERELSTLQTELSSLQNISADSTKLLTEKLALARELDNLKPELQDLRAQVESRKALLSDKLSLQRRVSSIQAELDDEKRTTEKLRARQKQHAQGDMELEAEVERLKTELAQEKRANDHARKAAEQSSSITETNEVRKELAREKREKEKAEKQVTDLRSEMKAERAVLEDKLNQFRAKLKSTKEKLKETEAELQEARSHAPTKPSAAPEPKARNPRKRAAVSVDPDAAIGTPGDARPAKRTQRASSVIGEKSNFSITPFLNRTSSIVPEDHSKGDDEDDVDEVDADKPLASIEVESPSAQRQATSLAGAVATKPLTDATSRKANVKIGSIPKERKKVAAKLLLEKVVEEPDDDEETTTSKGSAVPSGQPQQDQSRRLKSTSLKPRALSSFASFRAGSLPPKQLQNQQKKTRKLGRGAKTLFDEDEEEEVAQVEASGISKAGHRAFGALGSRGFGGLGAWAANKKKGPLMVADGGFMFSPLKKDRNAAAERMTVPEV